MSNSKKSGESLSNNPEAVTRLARVSKIYSSRTGGRSWTHTTDGLKQYPDMLTDLKPAHNWVTAQYGRIHRVKDN